MGTERISNWSLQTMTETNFVNELVAEQPFIPKYFGFNIAINRKGTEAFKTSLANVKRITMVNDTTLENLDGNIIAIDTRPQQDYKKGHLPNAINIINSGKF